MNRLVVLAAATVAFAAACTLSPASDTSESSERETAALTKIVDTTAGQVIADAQGLSLYTFDPDTSTASKCNNACARAWPPLFAPTDGSVLAAPFAEITRNDGKKQVSYNGHPLYRYVGDEHEGDITGDGSGGVWHLARPLAPAGDAGATR
jgi:predicted lipoprotein with Yx(FWY)xxD motif